MNDQSVEFLPYHAINEFMRDDYRLQVIQEVFNNENLLEEDLRNSFDKMTRLALKVPGFRNSAKAPTRVKIKPAVDAFERNPFFVAVVLECWSIMHLELKKNVYAQLSGRGWQILPVDTDRTQLPGFLMTWPAGETFEKLVTAFQELYPDDHQQPDDISLMVVWLSGRLPYQEDDEELEEEK